METITLNAVIDENHQLVVQVPDMAPGRVKVTVEPIDTAVADTPPEPMTREWVRAKLIEAGLVNPNARYAPEDAEELSEEEEERLGRLFASSRPMSELIDEDREERFLSEYFVDTSAFVKRYIPEVGSTWVTGWILPAAGNSIVISRLSTVEMISVLARRQREGNLALQDRIRLQNDFLLHVDKQQYIVIEPDEPVLNTARDLLLKYSLRTLDSIQLSSALEAARTLNIQPTIVTADTRLLAAAASEGLPTDNPNAHP